MLRSPSLARRSLGPPRALPRKPSSFSRLINDFVSPDEPTFVTGVDILFGSGIAAPERPHVIEDCSDHDLNLRRHDWRFALARCAHHLLIREQALVRPEFHADRLCHPEVETSPNLVGCSIGRSAGFAPRSQNRTHVPYRMGALTRISCELVWE